MVLPSSAPSTPPLVPTHLVSTVSPVPPSSPPPASAVVTTTGVPAALPTRAAGLPRINTSTRGSKRKRDRSHSPALASVAATEHSMSSSPPGSPRILRTHMAHLRLRSGPPGSSSSGLHLLDAQGSPSLPVPPAFRAPPPGAPPAGWVESPLPSPKRVRRPSASSAISNASDDESDDEPLQNTRMNFPVPAHLRSLGPSPLQNSFSAMFALASSPPKTRSVTKAAAQAGLQPSLMASVEVATGAVTAAAPGAATIAIAAKSPITSDAPQLASGSAAPGGTGPVPAEEKSILKARSRLLNVAATVEKQGTEVEKLHVLGYGRGLRSKANGMRGSGLAKLREDAPVESLEKAAEKLLRAKSKMQIDEQ